MAKWHGGYDWYDIVSDLTKDETASAPKNEQAAGVGVDTYARYAKPFGTIDKTKPSNLKFYNYGGKGDEVNRLARDSGYQVYFMGGKHGKPDLANRHYGTGHLAIWDPSSGSGGDFGEEDYTRNWRIAHETAHGQTLGELNKLYGDGRRMGKLGHHRTLREALRSVHWEWLAGHKQRELSRQMGVELSDEDFAKELNTVMHDAAHRAVTGKFTEPSGEGFHPHSKLVPLDFTLNMIREAAREKGLKGMDDLIIRPNKRILTKTQSSFRNLRKRAMTEKTYTLPEVKQELAKALKQRVDEFSREMLALRKKELAKSEVCLLCGNPDTPAACTCLKKSVEKCDTDDVKKLNKEERCSKCGKTECCCGEVDTKPEEPVKAQEGSGGKVSKLNKDMMNPTMGVTGGKLSTGSGSIEDMAMNESMEKSTLGTKISRMGRKLNPFRNKRRDTNAKLEDGTNPHVPVLLSYPGALRVRVDSDEHFNQLPHKTTLNGKTYTKFPYTTRELSTGDQTATYHISPPRKDVKYGPSLKSISGGGENPGPSSAKLELVKKSAAQAKDMQAMANQASYEAHTQSAAPAPKVKLPSPADNAARANDLQDFMPAGKFTPGGAGLPHERSPILSRKLGKAGLNPTKPTAPAKPVGAATPAVSKPPTNNAPKNTAPKAPSPASAPGAKDLKP